MPYKTIYQESRETFVFSGTLAVGFFLSSRLIDKIFKSEARIKDHGYRLAYLECKNQPRLEDPEKKS